MKAIVLWLGLVMPIMMMTDEPRRVKPAEVIITLEFVVDGDSEIFIGKKQVKVDDIPEDGIIAELKTDGNKIKKIVYEEKK